MVPYAAMKKDVLLAIAATLAVCVVAVVAAVYFGLMTLKPRGAAAQQSATAGNVVLRVNGRPVTEREFALFVTTLPEQMQPYATTPAGRKLVAEQMTPMLVLQQEAQKLGAQSDADAQARLALSDANAEAQWAAEKLAGTPTEAQLRAEYDKHRDEFASFELSQIVVAYQGGQIPAKNGKPLPPDQAMAKASRIEAQLHSGAKFGALAAAVSDDSASGAQGGKLGNVNAAQLPPDLQQAIVSLKPGEVSKPIQSRFGIHIFQVGERTAQPFEQLKPALQRQAQQATVSAAIDRLRKSAKIDYDPKFFGTAAAAPAPSTATQ